jgi:hypothetical protein
MKEHEYGGLSMEEYLTGETEVLGKRSAPVLLCSPQISHQVPGTNQSPMMKSQQLIP